MPLIPQRTADARPARRRLILAAPLLLSVLGCGPGEREPTRLLSRTGLDASALEALDAAHAQAEARPGDAEAHGMLALAYEVNGRKTEAVEAYANAAALDGSDPVWPFHRALCKNSLGDADGALSDLDEVVRRFPNLAAARFRRGVWRLGAGDLDGALEDFEFAVRAAPDDARMAVGLGSALVERGEYGRAIEVLSGALEDLPENGAAHFSRGRAYRAVGRLDEAERDMAIGMGAEIQFPGTRLDALRGRFATGLTALTSRGLDLLNAGQYKDAIAVFERARRAHPGDARLLNNLGTAYRLDGQAQRFLDMMLEAEKADPNFAPTYANLAVAHLGVRQPHKALSAARRAVLLAPNGAQEQFALGRSMLGVGDKTGAYFALVRAVELDPNLTIARAHLAEVCMATERYPEGREHLLVLIKQRPESLLHAINLGHVSLILGDREAAQLALDHARRIQPDHPRVLVLAAKISEAR